MLLLIIMLFETVCARRSGTAGGSFRLALLGEEVDSASSSTRGTDPSGRRRTAGTGALSAVAETLLELCEEVSDGCSCSRVTAERRAGGSFRSGWAGRASAGVLRDTTKGGVVDVSVSAGGPCGEDTTTRALVARRSGDMVDGGRDEGRALAGIRAAVWLRCKDILCTCQNIPTHKCMPRTT